MATACFRRYQPIVIDGKTQILHSRVENTWQLKDPQNGLFTHVAQSDLLKQYAEGKIKFIIAGKQPEDAARDLLRAEPRDMPEEITNDIWKLARAKMLLVKDVCNLGWQSSYQRQRIAELWPILTDKLRNKPKVPDASTVFRWWTKMQNYGWDGRALLPQHFKKGRRSSKLTGELLELVEEAVEDQYLTPERRPRVDAYEGACQLVLARNNTNRLEPLPLPTRRQVDAYIDSLDAFDVWAARYGHQAAIRKFRSVLGAAVATAPLQRVELDHTVLDVMVLDDETLLPLGRPTLAVAIDAFSRCVLGFCLGFEPPCTSTVSQCLKSAFSPKDAVLALVPDIENVWDAFGKMETLVLDQALENHAHFLDRLALTQAIEILYCPRKSPWFKARIERFIGTLNSSVCHKIPGTTFSNIQEKGDYNPICKAVCTMAGLKAAIIKWIVDIYHVRRHRTLQTSPIGLWRNSISSDEIPLATDLTTLETSIRMPVTKPLTHTGVECNIGLRYNSPDLIALRRRYGAELKVLAYPSSSDLGSIIVEHEESNSRFEVPCTEPEYAKGMTLWQQKAVRKHARDSGIGVASFEQLLRAKHSLNAIIFESMADCPLKQRVTAARLLQRKCEAKSESGPASKPPEMPPSTAFNRPAYDDDLDDAFVLEKESY